MRLSRAPPGGVVAPVEAVFERELLARLRRGDEGAFDLLYDAYRPRVFSFLVRLSKRRELAEELVQETFLRLARRAEGLAEDTVLRAWLFTVARNLYVSHLRATMLENERIDQLTLEEAGAMPSPFEAAAASETQATLERALGRLPAPQREAVLLVAVEGLEPAEAARIVGIEAEALRQRLSRGRALLRAALAEEDHPEAPAAPGRPRAGRGTGGPR